MVAYLWGLFLITFPFGYRFLVFEPWSYHFGNFNPWVSGFIYAPEVLLLVIFILWWIDSLRVRDAVRLQMRDAMNGRLYGVGILFLVNFFLVSSVQGTFILALFLFVRLLEAMMIYVLLKSEVLSRQRVVQCLLIGAGIQFLIAAFQIILNHSLGLSWLGEPVIGPEVLAVAKRDLAVGFKHIRAYGTFLHPNILAAYFLTVYFITQVFKVHKVIKFIKFFDTLFFVLIGIGLFFTFSRAAVLAFLIGLAMIFICKKIRSPKSLFRIRTILVILIFLLNLGLFFAPPFFHSSLSFVQERLSQIEISRAMIAAHPWGVGVGGFTLHMAEVSPYKLQPWNLQPVHNVYFLILNETGIQGLILLLAGIGYGLFGMRAQGTPLRAPTGILLILFLASFDHFFWDNWVGIMLIPFVFL